jgi:hypothetical protein
LSKVEGEIDSGMDEGTDDGSSEGRSDGTSDVITLVGISLGVIEMTVGDCKGGRFGLEGTSSLGS